MSSREEIREGIELLLRGLYNVHLDGDEYADRILTFLNEAGVVIKVDRGSPDNEVWHKVEREFEAYCAGRNELIKDGYVAVEPLIEEQGIDLFLCPYCHHEHFPGNPHIEEK